ncbi:MAG TPA: hypothetical protein VGV07_22365 [Devosia sp.]|uniref:hypothetical protein n=1 Tax=Devosia sp. TaxID=1871048 RepID=UPI002DDD9C5D|nr:hypothetical protein [Devosia sp.]HEV2518012.1 hypothetical protein [Devosia sp.]
MTRLNFHRREKFGLVGYVARAGQWQFLVISDMGKWTASHRLIDPQETVSASSTIQGPFETFDEAAAAAEAKYRELAGLN